MNELFVEVGEVGNVGFNLWFDNQGTIERAWKHKDDDVDGVEVDVDELYTNKKLIKELENAMEYYFSERFESDSLFDCYG